MCYTPEWNLSLENDKDSGTALVKSFVEILEQIINPLNEMPRKNFLEFVNLIGATYLSATASKVPVTVKLSEKVNQDVFLKEGAKFEAEANSAHPALTFESIEDMLVTKAKVIEVYSCVKSADAIFRHSEQYMNQKPFVLFSEENIQEHILYLSHDDLFNIKTNKIKLDINVTPVSEVDMDRLKDLFDDGGSGQIVSWEYGWEIDPNTGKEIKDSSKKLKSTVSQKIGMISIALEVDQEKEIQRQLVNSIEGRWIRCRLLPLAETSSPVKFWKALTPNIIKTIDISFSTDGPLPYDFLAHNDIPLQEQIKDPQGCHPFGDKPSSLDSFYIASHDAFSKKGESIRVDITFNIALLKFHKTFFHSDDTYPIISWEYWNGSGWALISDANTSKKSDSEDYISFVCPTDIEPVTVIGQNDYWIRARIVSGDYGKAVLKLVIKDRTVFWEEDVSAIKEPLINKVSISVISETPKFPKFPMHCLTYNNLQYSSHLDNAGQFDSSRFQYLQWYRRYTSYGLSGIRWQNGKWSSSPFFGRYRKLNH